MTGKGGRERLGVRGGGWGWGVYPKRDLSKPNGLYTQYRWSEENGLRLRSDSAHVSGECLAFSGVKERWKRQCLTQTLRRGCNEMSYITNAHAE